MLSYMFFQHKTQPRTKFKMVNATRLRNTDYPRTLLLPIISVQNCCFRSTFISLIYNTNTEHVLSPYFTASNQRTELLLQSGFYLPDILVLVYSGLIEKKEKTKSSELMLSLDAPKPSKYTPLRLCEFFFRKRTEVSLMVGSIPF